MPTLCLTLDYPAFSLVVSEVELLYTYREVFFIMNKIQLKELSSPGCHHCAEFERFWRSIEKEWPNVEYRNVSILSPEGQELVQTYMIFSAPGIIMNGELFSTGGFNKEKFAAKLKELSGK